MSYYSKDMDFIFIHTPKCAGTSMEAMKWIQRGGHTNYRAVLQEKDVNKDAFAFAFVRNPYDRMVSLFHAAKGNSIAWPKVPDTFPEYIQMIWEEGRYVVPHEHTMAHFLVDVECNVGMDFVGRYENLQEDWKKVCEIIEAPKEDWELPWKNKTEHKDWTEFLDDDSIDHINEMFHVDFLLFGYDKL
jgi:hypothetical protein